MMLSDLESDTDSLTQHNNLQQSAATGQDLIRYSK